MKLVAMANAARQAKFVAKAVASVLVMLHGMYLNKIFLVLLVHHLLVAMVKQLRI
jgi:hypothetical protein